MESVFIFKTLQVVSCLLLSEIDSSINMSNLQYEVRCTVNIMPLKYYSSISQNVVSTQRITDTDKLPVNRF